MDLNVEWDDQKYHSNFLKHGIRFEEAVPVFSDENALEFFETEEMEIRYIRIGLNPNIGILVVVYCERLENVIRIISARKATRTEEFEYEKRIRF